MKKITVYRRIKGDYLKEQGLNETGFKMGIGLNSGPFMSGNVGSARRLEYTIHGDTVNTGARVEELTKRTGRSILLSEATREALNQRPDDLDCVGDVEIRGRRSAVRLWSPASARL